MANSNKRNWLKKVGMGIIGITFLPFKMISSSLVQMTEPSNTIIQSQNKLEAMKLGVFSVSLNVKDLTISKVFYENLGFTVFAGDLKMNYLIMKNESTIIGLFQGMFEKNILTFNPGWDENAQKLDSFIDVRDIQKNLKNKGIKLEVEADETTTGPANIVVLDPDGNPILFDQHV
ncbi:MAG TPA: VOC family protein [Saprospiraceae bacterium]|nr:VOC family protein [Saprospiraceae bacterium]